MTSLQTTRQIDTMAQECIAVRVRLLNRVITNIYDDVLRPLGMKVSQMNILVAAAKLGIARPAVVCDLLQLDASTLSRNVERMVASGWLEIVPEDDARTQPFKVSVKGKRLIEQAFPAWQEAQQRATELLGQNGVDLLRGSCPTLKPRAKS
ncbi:MAG TPA: MarR family winged helix-turn-helix transcriptional regulator [Pirellulales bacterium]|nr:MarR family winged helix-turn-helix transcriptional regulator [Pirellulales bacterium]